MYYGEAIHQHIRRLVQRWADAERSANAEAVAELLAQGFVLISPGGCSVSRDRYLYARQADDVRYESLILGDVDVHIYSQNSAAFVIGTLTRRGWRREKDLAGEFRLSMT